MQRTDQAGFVGMKADRHQLDLEVFILENDSGARDREFAEPAVAKPATDHDALGLVPRLGLEEFSRHIGQFLRKLLDRAVQDGGRLQIVADQNGVELLLADLVRRLVTERILVRLAQRLAPFVENLAKRPLAGAVAEKTVFVLQFEVETVDLDRRQPGCAMAGDTRRRHDVVSHGCPCPRGNRGHNEREPVWLRPGRAAAGHTPSRAVQAASLRIWMTSPGSRIGCGFDRVKIESMAFSPISLKRSSPTPTSDSRRGSPSSAMKPAKASLASRSGAPRAAAIDFCACSVARRL